MKLPELLSPVGSEQALAAAVNNGCDAIYIGGKNFSARASAENFTDERLKEIIAYAHLRGVKSYITLNTLYKDSELKGLLEFAARMYEYGADAFIVQDIGAAAFIKQNFKGIKLHASTQMTTHNAESAKFLYSIGFDRICLSRELSLEEIKAIKGEPDLKGLELEVFVHGALCVSYSGQCTMSSIIGQRSGNRGRCAQTCRMPFELLKDNEPIESGYLLSTKDIMSLGMLKELCSIGIDSLKIEGRMRGADYVSTTTKTYRAQLDKSLLGDYSVKSD
ncbi:MAG: U32 family peptidase, partial [Clostridiales bacterium]|nr:U32 family peptidase [Clostridiales bacterium]